MTAPALQFVVSEAMPAAGGVFVMSLPAEPPELRAQVIAGWKAAWFLAGLPHAPPLLLLDSGQEFAAMGAAELRARAKVVVRRPRKSRDAV